MKKIWFIIIGVILAAALVMGYLVFLTDTFDTPLTAEQIEDRVAYIGDNDRLFMSFAGKSGTTDGNVNASYTAVTSYSQYNGILDDIEEIDPALAERIRSEMNLDWSFFNKYTLIFIEDVQNGACINTVDFTDNKLSLLGTKDEDDKTWLVAVTVSNKTWSDLDGVSLKLKKVTYAFKPVVYLYPEEPTEVCVKLGYKDKITVSYPEYVDGWSVLAQPDGKLVYNETGRKLYSLYYESENLYDYSVQDDGFVVKGEDVAAFLEEKLAILGLNEYEMEEFIIYWLPILQANEYNYIRFATAEEIERNMPLEINPCPDTVVRVLMTVKGLDEPIEVTEQQLTAVERKGFVAVEWGCSVIN